MILTHVKVFLCRRELKIIIFSTITGGILQILCKKYVKNDTEVLNKYKETIKRIPRGGETVVTVTIVQAILSFLAEHGLTAGLISGIGIVIKEIPLTSLSTYLRDSIPQNFSHLDKKKFILVNNEKMYLDQCNENLSYLFNILQDETIPFEERKQISHSILTQYLNLKTSFGRRNFVLCIIFIIYILFSNYRSSFYIMMKNLIKAIKEDKITKPMARFIIRKLRKRGVPIDPELVELVKS